MRELWSKMFIGLGVKYPLFLSGFKETSISRQTVSKNTEISNFMKILPVIAEFFHEDGLTDMTKLLAFRNFANAPQNDSAPPNCCTKLVGNFLKVCT
jgi:hypothetical protein